MPRIKLIRVHNNIIHCDTCNYTFCQNAKLFETNEQSEWEDVTEEELKWLQSPQGKKRLSKYNTEIVILEDITSKKTIDGFIENIKKFIQDEQEKEKEEIKKQEEAQQKRKALAEKKQIERAKKVLEKSGIKVD
jgi:DNA polymerase II small subunit/DNA polymerase delta subunit B